MKNLWNLLIDFMYKLKDVLELTSAFRVIMLIVDITLVAFIVYYVIRIIKQTRAMQIVKGILMLFLLMIVSKALNLVILDFILTNIKNTIGGYNMKIDYTIRLEKENDYREVENLTREAFWNVYRPGCLEHYVLHKFRDRADFVHQLSFVLEKNGKIIGHIMYAHSQIQCDNGDIIPIMTFGPLSILPEERGKGYGTMLLQYSMDKAKELEVKALAITGNINFYKKSEDKANRDFVFTLGI